MCLGFVNTYWCLGETGGGHIGTMREYIGTVKNIYRDLVSHYLLRTPKYIWKLEKLRVLVFIGLQEPPQGPILVMKALYHGAFVATLIYTTPSSKVGVLEVLCDFQIV